MLGVRLHGRGHGQQPVAVAVDGGDPADGRLAGGEGAGLVEQDRVHHAHPLQGQAVLDQDAVAGRQGGGDGDDQGDGQAEGVRAGDHQHGHGALDRLVGLAEGQPHDHGDQPGPEGEPEQQRGRPVGQGLGPRPGRLGLLDQPADPGQGGLLPHRVDPDPDGGVGDHGAGHHPTARAPGHRAGLAGDHRLVKLGAAVGDHAVGRDTAARADQHQVAHDQVADRRRPGPLGGDQVGLVGQQRGQGVQGPGGLAEGTHLQPVAEQHDHDQQGQLPPELQVEQAQGGGGAGPEADQDGQGDQQHHARLPGPGLGQAAFQERPAAVEEDDRPQHRRDPLRARELRRGEPQPLLDHLGVGDHRDGQGQAPPEPVPEPGRVVPVAAVSGVLVVGGVALVVHQNSDLQVNSGS
jgi:hypothetical protein